MLTTTPGFTAPAHASPNDVADTFAGISLLDPDSVIPPDFLQQAENRAGQTGLSDWLQDSLEPDGNPIMPAPAAPIAENLDSLYQAAQSAEPLEPDPQTVSPNNAARMLDMVREWQSILNDTLSQRSMLESKSFLGAIGSLFSSLIDIDSILDLAESRLDNLIGDRSDSDEIKAYAHHSIRLFIRERLGNNWRELLLQLTESNAQDLIERYQSWFDQAGGRPLDQYTRADVNALIDRLLGVENPAEHSQLTRPPDPVTRPSDPVGTSGGSSPPTQTTGSQATQPGPASSDYFVTRLSIQEAGTTVRSSQTVEQILQLLFGWSDDYGEAADDQSFGWRLDSQTQQYIRYYHPHYTLEVSYDQAGGIAVLSTRVYTADQYVVDYQNLYKPAGSSPLDLNRQFLRIEFTREGSLKSIQDFVFVRDGAPASAYLLDLDVREAIFLIRKAGSVGRHYTFGNGGVPRQALLYNGDTLIRQNYNETGILASEATYTAIDPQLYRDGAQHNLSGNMRDAYDLADLACYALNGLYQSFYPDGITQVSAMFVNGQANGATQTFDQAGRLRTSFQLAGNIRQGDFAYYDESSQGQVYLRASGQYDQDRRHGLWTFYQENSLVTLTVTYSQGILDGPAVAYDELGQIRAKGSFSQGSASEYWEKFTNGVSVGLVKPERAFLWTHEMNEYVATLVVEWP
ncbi:MAG: hypothetical protein M0P55_09965 [Clostridiales bacterium]|nr:hypothetical protein [Clostridiales bacterium]